MSWAKTPLDTLLKEEQQYTIDKDVDMEMCLLADKLGMNKKKKTLRCVLAHCSGQDKTKTESELLTEYLHLDTKVC
ncbi:hypothetical protein ACLKA7_016624 [Drosophila subpalustris]